MARLGEDSFILTHRGGNPARPAIGPVWSLLALASLALMLLSRLEHSYIAAARALAADAAAPVLRAVRAPLEPVRWAAHQASAYFAMVESFDRLKNENRELERWKQRATELERQLAELGRLAQVVNVPAIPFVSARVIAAAPDAFGHSVLLGIGRSSNIVAGYAVVDAGGLIGRIVDAHAESARVLLINDLKSRIPVHVGDARVRGLMIGDNGPRPRLGYLPENAQLNAGDIVMTSGEGGLLPRGLPVGKVVLDGGQFAIEPNGGLLAPDFVTVLLYATPALELSDGPGARAAGRRAQAPARAAPEGPR